MTETEDIRATARNARMRIIELSHRSKTAHLGSALSCVDILVAAYWGGLRLDPSRPSSPDRDRFILSKGHAAMALYTVLAMKGYFSKEDLETFGKGGGIFQEHPLLGIPGVDAASGSLGHGLPLANGMALASRILGTPYRVAVVMGDGECNEGSVWEAALFAAAKRLDNLIAFVDYNKWQATGRSDEVLALPDLAEKWSAFGWDTREIDGHDMGALRAAFADSGDSIGRPRMIIAHTVKGKGVSFMEDDNNWHYRIPNADEVEKARVELALS